MIEFKCNCCICGKEKTYKSKQGYEKCKDKPCKSCANSLTQGGKGNRQVVDGKYVCAKCDKNLPVEDFYFKKDKPYSYCKVCHVGKSHVYHKEIGRFNKYGITKEDYDKMLKKQEGKCAGCKKEFTNPHIDHCHRTGKGRGILCPKCNKALCQVNDDIDIL